MAKSDEYFGSTELTMLISDQILTGQELNGKRAKLLRLFGSNHLLAMTPPFSNVFLHSRFGRTIIFWYLNIHFKYNKPFG
jgi:hypothetical protein